MRIEGRGRDRGDDSNTSRLYMNLQGETYTNQIKSNQIKREKLSDTQYNLILP